LPTGGRPRRWCPPYGGSGNPASHAVRRYGALPYRTGRRRPGRPEPGSLVCSRVLRTGSRGVQLGVVVDELGDRYCRPAVHCRFGVCPTAVLGVHHVTVRWGDLVAADAERRTQRPGESQVEPTCPAAGGCTACHVRTRAELAAAPPLRGLRAPLA